MDIYLKFDPYILKVYYMLSGNDDNVTWCSLFQIHDRIYSKFEKNS